MLIHGGAGVPRREIGVGTEPAYGNVVREPQYILEEWSGVAGGYVRRFVSNANPRGLGFTLISKDGRLETAFCPDHNTRGSLPK